MDKEVTAMLFFSNELFEIVQPFLLNAMSLIIIGKSQI